MEFKISMTINGTTTNSTLSYQVTSPSAGIYNVNVSIGSSLASGIVVSSAFSVDSNNDTVLSASEVISNQSITLPKSEAKSDFDSMMSLFGLEETYGGELGLYTSSAYFHSTGTAPMTFGTTTFPVTTYVANSLPTTVSACGITNTITAYTLKVGAPPGTSLQFITYLNLAISSPQSENITFQLVSMTVA